MNFSEGIRKLLLDLVLFGLINVIQQSAHGLPAPWYLP